MVWGQETIEKSMELYFALAKKGYITDKDEDYLQWFDERDIQDFIRKVIEPKAKVMIFKDEESKTIQMVPEMENDIHSFTNEELKKRLNLKDNKEVHLFYFIFYILISELTHSRDRELVTRLYIPMDELLDKMNDYVHRYEQMGEVVLEKLSDSSGVDLIGVVEAWTRMAEFKEGASDHLKTKNNHRVYIEKTLRFLQEEKLIFIRGFDEVSVTNKLELIITHYYHNVQNKNRIQDLLFDPNTLKGEE